MNPIPEINFTPAKCRRQRFSGPVDPETACRWPPQVSPYHRCWPDDGEISLSDAPWTPGDDVRKLFRCHNTVHPMQPPAATPPSAVADTRSRPSQLSCYYTSFASERLSP